MKKRLVENQPQHVQNKSLFSKRFGEQGLEPSREHRV